MTSKKWILYGANGYTGALVAELAAGDGHELVLAGRSSSVADLAGRLGRAHEVLDLSDPAALDALLNDADVVLHCAGPFSQTARPMLEACLRTGTHYADITGEIDVFESAYALHDQATAAGIAIVPGVGFDVVPTDHLLMRLAAQMPDADRADVAVISRGGFSTGTLRTVLEGLRAGGVVRESGRLRTVRTAHRRRTLNLGGRTVEAFSIPLGDVASGYHATGIPTITNFTNMPAGRVLGVLDPLLRRSLANHHVFGLADRAISRFSSGPGASRRSRVRSAAWVALGDAQGHTLTAAIEVPSTYAFTARSALHATRRLLDGDVTPGAWTPAQAFGTDFIHSIPDVDVVDLS